MKSIENKVAIVTGGSRGIGRVIAEGFLTAGAKVIVCARNLPEAEINSAGNMADFVRCDVRNADEIRNVVNYCESKYGRLDILVNNAGVTWSEDIDTFHEKAWDKVMDLDVKSPFFLTQQLLPLIRAAACLLYTSPSPRDS